MSMTDLPTLEAALKLADQDSPLPSLAGPALKRLRDAVNGLSIYNEGLQDAMLRIMRALGIAGAKPSEVASALEKRLADRVAIQADKGDSATLTTLIAEFRARETVGRTKYGADVDRTDFAHTQWRQHLREELMDALLYSLAEERTAPAATDFTKLSPEGKAAWGSAVRDHIAARTPKVGEAKERAQPMGEVECGGRAPPAASPNYQMMLKTIPYGEIGEFLAENTSARAVAFIMAEERTGTSVAADFTKLSPQAKAVWGSLLNDYLAAPHSPVRCWCETCRPITFTDMRMVLCPTCGNKRCPHAHDHRNACTGSNAVGQPGSSWEHVKPITPPVSEDC